MECGCAVRRQKSYSNKTVRIWDLGNKWKTSFMSLSFKGLNTFLVSFFSPVFGVEAPTLAK
jgi:hypothetical protein